ncbi:hypothetical protein EDS67_21835 [candidate division KSB1 bacterium]|nr:MAG: hypothetical protein EDS67_21835 [candidate division KSB1 bacterium]MCE7944492.1 hypothetical protein [Chlorobi bacterium CHB1]MDL1874791.1 hypothetical protein [Cytophagia bacterium CHB2]
MRTCNRVSPGVILLLWASLAFATSDSPSEQKQSQIEQPHVTALRRELGLSPHLLLEWLPSSNSVDTLRVTDNFNRAEIGSDWGYDPRYWRIVDGELWQTPEAMYEWRYLAVFKPVFNEPGRTIHAVSYRWGKNADALGIREGAHALMIDDPSENGSGYWLWHRNNWNQVWLWIIKYGTWEYYSRQGKSVDQQPANADPQAGDVVTAYIRNEPDAVYFDYYVNDQWDATLQDPSKEFPKDNTWYAGVFIHGEQLNNQVDDFTITWTQSDAVPPANITDLAAIDSSSNAVTLQWTMTGDNGNDGNARNLEIRYSTSPIASYEFTLATLAADLPEPAASGQKQNFTITGLQAGTHYYFAMRVFDEAGNGSEMSNLAEATTTGQSVAQRLALVSGCDQSARVGETLALPLVVRVTDQDSLPFKGKSVQFAVISGEADFEDSREFTVITDANGLASAPLTLGTQPQNIKVEIRASGLAGSPIACAATALPGFPAELTVVSGDDQLVSLNAATEPLVVRITDRFQNLLANQPVTFKRISGNSGFANGELQQTVVSDNLGLAGVTLIASNIYGDTTIILAKPDSAASNAVQDTFMVVTASPDSMRIVSGDQQTAAIATTLPQPLVVQLWDNAGAPLQDYPVLFKILGSGGKLAGGSDSVAISTDSSGVAQTSWTLGAVAGLQQVVAEAQFNEKALRQSPLLFTATAVTGGVSAVLSQVVLASEPIVLADSQAAAIINIYLKDDFGNVITGKPVEIEVSGQNNFIKQPDSLTNHQGLATAELRSTVAERKVIKARVVSDSLVLQDSVIVRFIALPAAQLQILSGNQQNGMVNRVLAQPLAVRARDKFGNFAGASRVVFTVLAGEGSIVGNHIVTSDSNGAVQVQWQLGPQPGLNRLSARLQDSPHVAVEFSAKAIDSTTTGVADDTGTLPQQFALHQNSPNPFNPETMMQFSLPEAAQVELSIYDLTGRRIKILLVTPLPAGAHRVRWNGKDEAGQSLHSGVYFYTLRARMLHSGKTMTATRKLALIK